jgi:uncharacterized protein YndB with AHSA1/START domain
MSAAADNVAELSGEKSIRISRVFDAPRELVWQAWTDPQQVGQWWGPNGFTTTIEKMDFREGGEWIHTMHGPDGTDYPNHSVFLKIQQPELIQYSHGGAKKDGPEARFTSTWIFEDLDGNRTGLTMVGEFASAEARRIVVETYRVIEGGRQTLGRLAEYLEKKAAVA